MTNTDNVQIFDILPRSVKRYLNSHGDVLGSRCHAMSAWKGFQDSD